MSNGNKTYSPKWSEARAKRSEARASKQRSYHAAEARRKRAEKAKADQAIQDHGSFKAVVKATIKEKATA